jgi:hypothetical protein
MSRSLSKRYDTVVYCMASGYGGVETGGEFGKERDREKGESIRALFVVQRLSAYKTIIVS